MARKLTQHMMTFSCRIFHNKDSQNLLGFNATPRYWCEPLELLEVLEVESNPNSVDRGFQKDAETGWFLKNIDEYTKEQAGVDFVKLKFTPPYGFNPSGYQNWYQLITNKIIQDSLETLYKTGVDLAEGKEMPIAETMGSKFPYYDTIIMDVIHNEINNYDTFDITNKKGCQLKLK